jgi:hypothetical protein
LKERNYPGGDSNDHWPTLGLNTLRWAKKQGAITGPAHSGSGLQPSDERIDGPDGPNGLPNYAIPSYNGIGANEYIVDITHDIPGLDGKPVPAIDFISTMDTNRQQELNMWYHTLNCGFRIRASGETDFPCISGARVGIGRVYVKIDGRLNYEDWCEGIREGRSYVSDGTCHLMEFATAMTGDQARKVAVGMDDSELKLSRPATVRLTAKASAPFRTSRSTFPWTEAAGWRSVCSPRPIRTQCLCWSTASRFELPAGRPNGVYAVSTDAGRKRRSFTPRPSMRKPCGRTSMLAWSTGVSWRKALSNR